MYRPVVSSGCFPQASSAAMRTRPHPAPRAWGCGPRGGRSWDTGCCASGDGQPGPNVCSGHTLGCLSRWVALVGGPGQQAPGPGEVGSPPPLGQAWNPDSGVAVPWTFPFLPGPQGTRIPARPGASSTATSPTGIFKRKKFCRNSGLNKVSVAELCPHKVCAAVRTPGPQPVALFRNRHVPMSAAERRPGCGRWVLAPSPWCPYKKRKTPRRRQEAGTRVTAADGR